MFFLGSGTGFFCAKFMLTVSHNHGNQERIKGREKASPIHTLFHR